MASAWATLAAYGSMTAASYFIGRRHYKVPYEIGKVIFYIVTSGALGYLMFNYFYENYLIKIILLIAYILMVYLIEQKELKKLLKR
jgi:hypothetical protein